MLNITLKQMRYIEMAGRLGSIASAATALSISQSSISAAIDALEEHLEFDLFVRTPAKGIHTTPAGQEAVRIMREFLDQYRHFETELTSVGGDASGTIRIACFVTAIGSFMPPILHRFQNSNPNVVVQLIEGSMEGVVDVLNDGKADMAFTYSDVVGPTHQFEPLVEVPPYALVAHDHPLAAQSDVSLAELAALPMVLFDLPRTEGYYLRFMTDAGHNVQISHRTRSVEMVRTLVASGFGFSILNARPPEYIEGRSNYRALPFRETLPPRVFGILRQAGMRQPLVVRRFIELCDEHKAKRGFESMIVRKASNTVLAKN